MSLFGSLKVGQVVVFAQRPCGSWLNENEPYQVEWKTNDSAYLRSLKRGSGTFDKAWAINRAIIAKAARTPYPP